MTAELLSLDTPKLTLVGFSDKGAFVTIGSVPLEDPSTRYTMIDEILGHVESCAASDTRDLLSIFLLRLQSISNCIDQWKPKPGCSPCSWVPDRKSQSVRQWI